MRGFVQACGIFVIWKAPHCGGGKVWECRDWEPEVSLEGPVVTQAEVVRTLGLVVQVEEGDRWRR